MEKKDLMIGDWVQYTQNCYTEKKGVWSEVHYGRVCSVGLLYVKVDRGSVAIEPEIVKPIPLTAEILEKNGIVFDYTIKLYDDYGNPYEIKGYALHGTTKWGDDYLLQYDEDKDLHISTEIYGEITLHNINYVHELQHALRLFGIEKEIEL